MLNPKSSVVYIDAISLSPQSFWTFGVGERTYPPMVWGRTVHLVGGPTIIVHDGHHSDSGGARVADGGGHILVSLT